ncbi:hypothetical protein [Bartonella doshiae]|uniref:hypothetical protein n=1 Tax=Bartonella doshiae TaxID=33044 RepID=UPI000941D657|nr:hypothetical protein [Bartonella doshiae]
MIFSLQRFLTIAFLLTSFICSVKNTYAKVSLIELSLSNLTLDEKYKHVKERLRVIEKRIKFIEKAVADLTLSQIHTPSTEYDKLIQEQKKLIDERINLSSELHDLAKEKQEFISRAHRAREYEIGEYEGKVSKVRRYLKSRRPYELGLNDDDYIDHLDNRSIYEIVKYYPMFILSCKINEDILRSDVGDLLRKDFGWKEEDFSWAKDAINLIDQELIKGLEELMTISLSDFKEYMLNDTKDRITRNPSSVKNLPLWCKTIRKVHNIMLPDKKKNILNRMRSHIEEWLNKK